jgi:hypothetical protein
MAICEPVFSPQTRATEVGQLIHIAMDCGLAKNPELFNEMLDMVYGKKNEIEMLTGTMTDYMAKLAGIAANECGKFTSETEEI